MSVYTVGYNSAVHSISTSVFRGSVLTATQLAGMGGSVSDRQAQVSTSLADSTQEQLSSAHVLAGLTSPQYCV